MKENFKSHEQEYSNQKNVRLLPPRVNDHNRAASGLSENGQG